MKSTIILMAPLTLAALFGNSMVLGGEIVVNIDCQYNDGEYGHVRYTGTAAAPDAGTYWNQLSLIPREIIDAVASDGFTPTTVDLTAENVQGAYFQDNNANALLDDYWFDNTMVAKTITISSLLPNTEHTLYMYGNETNVLFTSEGCMFTFGGETKISLGAQTVPIPPNPWLEGQDHVIFNVTSDANGQIVGTYGGDGNYNRWNGIQILWSSVTASGVTIVQTDGTTNVSESGPTSDSYTIVIETEPANSVTITVDPDEQTDVGNGTGASRDYIFTQLDWDNAQTVTVTAVTDGIDEGRHTSTITHTSVSSDGNYGGISIDDVIAIVTEYDNAGKNWPGYRADGQLTGLSYLQGNMANPQILWSYYTGSRESLLTVDLEGTGGTFTLPTSNISIPGGDMTEYNRQWGYDGPYYDLDETGSYTHFTSQELANRYKIGNFLPAQPGLEMVEWKIISTNTPQPMEMFIRSGGSWSLDWTNNAIAGYASGAANRNVIVGDFDDDGQLEASALSLGRAHILDVATGGVEQLNTTTFTGRGYGWFGSVDFNGDGPQEMVILADTRNHVGVMGWSGGNLVKLWHREIESVIKQKQTDIVPGVNPVEDIDGDGVPEIVFSIYNYDYASATIGGNQWHILVLDGMTGALILDLTDLYLTGLRDIDNDGIIELFTTSTNGRDIQNPGTLTIYSYENQILSALWQSLQAAAFQKQKIEDFPSNVTTSSPDGWQTLLAGPITDGGRVVFFTYRITEPETNTIQATAWQADAAGAVQSLATMEAPYLEVLAVRPAELAGDPTVLVHVEVPSIEPAQMTTVDASAAAVYSELLGNPLSTAVVGQLGDGAPATVVTEGASKVMQAFHPRGELDVETIWRMQGHTSIAQVDGVIRGDDTALLADLTGDGNLETIFATRGPGGIGRMVALLPDGTELWHHDFEAIPWEKWEYVTPGMGGWFAGNFTSQDHADLFVTVQRGTGHTGQEGYMLSGIDGSEIWHRTAGGSTPYGAFGVGGQWMVVYDHDGDDLDDILSNFPMTIYVMRGYDGQLILDEFVQYLFGPDAYNGYIFAADFRNNGQIEIQYGVRTPGFAMLNSNAEIIWNNPTAGASAFLFPGLGDIDGDGTLEFLQVGSGSLLCIDSLTGSLEWSLPGTGGYVSPVTADINGNGRHEAIVASGNTLKAVGYNGAGGGQTLWTVSFPDNIGAPAIAEINCTTQIVVVCKNGYVYGVGTPISYIREDLNKNCRVDLPDFVAFAIRWLDTGCSGQSTCGGADFDESTAVDIADLRSLIAKWLDCTCSASF